MTKDQFVSFPLWERGLKHLFLLSGFHCPSVVPLVGTWIETAISFTMASFVWSFPLWERGLKLVDSIVRPYSYQSFPLWERGLKLLSINNSFSVLVVVPLVGTWIETLLYAILSILFSVVPLVGTWIETRGR